jgi:hypothetical protein
MLNVCNKCAKPLKDKVIMKGGKPTTVKVCKSPICKVYDKPQGES